jgi:hypothetical protein
MVGKPGVRPSPGAETSENPRVWIFSHGIELFTLLRPRTGALRQRNCQPQSASPRFDVFTLKLELRNWLSRG